MPPATPATARSGTAADGSREVIVSRAGLGDLEALVPLFAAYRVFYGQPDDTAAARAFLEERLRKAESVIFIARIDGKAAGFTQLYPCFSSVRAQRTWLLNDLYVAEGARRKGIASGLLDAARQHGLATGAGGLTLQTDRGNAAAQALYEREGWIRQTGYYWYDLPLAQDR